jgi:hypothetical protein
VADARDVQLAGLGAVVATVSLAFAFTPPAAPARPDVTPLAAVQSATGEVKRRPAAMLGWQRLVREMNVFEGDAVFVPPGGAATLHFDDGTELDLDERSLVVVEVPKLGVRTLQLRQGSVSGRVGEVKLDIQTPNGTAQLERSSEARVELEKGTLAVAVKKGSAAVARKGAKTTLSTGQRGSATEAGVVNERPWPVELTAPAANLTRVFSGAPPALELRWSGAVPTGARVQVARDRFFAFLDREVAAAGDTLTIDRPAVGVTWWRLVDAQGAALSESRRFVFSEDIAPVTMQPRQGDVVLAPEGGTVAFAWTPLVGVSKYRVELSPSQGFEPVTLSKDVTQAEVQLPLPLPEGTWFWRVRVVDDRDASLPSAISRFRLIHKGIPEAPELYNPEIEVGH